LLEHIIIITIINYYYNHCNLVYLKTSIECNSHIVNVNQTCYVSLSADKIYFAYESPMSLPDCVKIWLISFYPKVTHALLISATQTFDDILWRDS